MSAARQLGFVSIVFIQACTEAGAPRASPEFEAAAAGISHASGGAFSNVAIPAGTTIWFNSEVRYSGLPSRVVHLYSNGGRIAFSAGGVNYSLAVPDGVVTIDPRLTSASTSFSAGSWQTNVPLQYAGQTFVAALSWVAPVNLPGSISNVSWTTNFQSEVSFSLTWQWSAATYSSFTADMSAVGVKPVDNQWINPYANSDTAGTPENYRNRLIPGARTGGGTNYIGVPVTMPAFAPDTPCAGVTCNPNAQCQTASSCDVRTGQCVGTDRPNGTACSDGNACTAVDSCQAGVCTGSSPVVCSASDACHVAGVCNPANGQCSSPIAANGAACNDGNACTQSDTCQAGVCIGTNPRICTASDACHVAGSCDPASGACSNPNAANGTSCTDGNACTQTDTCQAGVCTGTNPVSCVAADACFTASCQPSSGACFQTHVAGACCGDGVCDTSENGESCPNDCWLRTVSLVSGALDTCALLEDGSVRCLGENGYGQRGIESRVESDVWVANGDLEPRVRLGSGRQAVALSVGYAHVCAILDDRSLKCWGANFDGELGLGDTRLRGVEKGEMGDSLPTVDLGIGAQVIQVSAGDRHTCALLADHRLKCWGNNQDGILGLGDLVSRGGSPGQMGDALPSVDFGPGRYATQVIAGALGNCAILDDQSVRCWGSGFGTSPGGPLDTDGHGVLAMAVASTSWCLLRDDHQVACFGPNWAGELGLGDMTPRTAPTTPVDLGTGRTVRQLAGGFFLWGATFCATLDDWSTKCWGGTALASLGDAPGEMGDSLPAIPLPVGRRVSVLETFSGAILDDQSSYDWRTAQNFNWGVKLGCGDGHVVTGEACDDGDLRAGDGCSRACTIEPGFVCSGDSSDCRSVCGDGLLVGLETCDDGNQVGRDGCSATCAVEANWTCYYPDPCERRNVDVRVAGAVAMRELPALNWAVMFGVCNLGTEEALVPLSLRATDTTGREVRDDSQYRTVAPASCQSYEWNSFLSSGANLASAEIVTEPSDADPSDDRMFADMSPPAHPIGIAAPRTLTPNLSEVPVCYLGVTDDFINITAAGVTSDDPILDASDPIGIEYATDTLGSGTCTILQVHQDEQVSSGLTWFGARVSVDGTVDAEDSGALGNFLLVGP